MTLTTGLDSDWGYEYKDDKFILHIQPATQHYSNLREACVARAKDLNDNLRNPVMSMSGGLDCQLVLHSFYEQGIRLDCIFRHFPGHNDRELANINQLKKKYGFDLQVVTIIPEECKEEILDEYKQTGIHPNQLLYKKFYSMVDPTYDILQGLDGPNTVLDKKDNKLYYFESYNSFEFSRHRAVNLLNRPGRFVSFEKNSNLTLAIFNEEIVDVFFKTFNYFLNNQVTGVKFVDMWDVYVKPYVYYKHWKDELTYFPKYQGPEGIEWIMTTLHLYRNNLIMMELDSLKKHLESGQETQTFVGKTYSE